MRALTATFRIVTPLFLGGPDPNEEADLRPPSLKGLLRYWYRAVDPEYRHHEARIFGGTGTKDGQSVFSLCLSKRLSGREPWDRNRYDRPPFKEGQGRATVNGLIYLGYSLRLGDNDRKAISPDSTFTVQVRELRATDPRATQAVAAALWLLGHLGSAGSRARRGFGSLSLERWEGSWPELSSLPLASGAATPEEWMGHLRQGLATIRRWFGTPTGTPDHTVIASGTPVYLLRQGFEPRGDLKGWELALSDLGRLFQRARQRSEPDYRRVRDHLLKRSLEALRPGQPPPPLPQGATPRLLTSGDTIERAAFGLPLAFRFSSLDRKLRFTGTTFQGRDHDRSASPLFLRVARIKGRCHAMAVLLSSPLLPARDSLKEKGSGPPLALPDRAIVRRFCDQVLGPRSLVEVIP